MRVRLRPFQPAGDSSRRCPGRCPTVSWSLKSGSELRRNKHLLQDRNIEGTTRCAPLFSGPSPDLSSAQMAGDPMPVRRLPQRWGFMAAKRELRDGAAGVKMAAGWLVDLARHLA